MRKWLIILALLVIGIVGVLWWLGQSLEAQKPADKEVRTEIEHVL
jgi:flagellar basal body-associated protein FliL